MGSFSFPGGFAYLTWAPRSIWSRGSAVFSTFCCRSGGHGFDFVLNVIGKKMTKHKLSTVKWQGNESVILAILPIECDLPIQIRHPKRYIMMIGVNSMFLLLVRCVYTYLNTYGRDWHVFSLSSSKNVVMTNDNSYVWSFSDGFLQNWDELLYWDRTLPPTNRMSDGQDPGSAKLLFTREGALPRSADCGTCQLINPLLYYSFVSLLRAWQVFEFYQI